ncbi:hypothetical protein KIN20_014706 [Parelaphostrongylus tenuis]|uniref:Uncharacterized protein n=1 Tax=Parelaphostrongylus tenuis TaxID=148309 RepID=A0AAD5MDY1_PARTN|nr:hypothetical protein KIN20_014706 [Parelaphostrongylus tenuis]
MSTPYYEQTLQSQFDSNNNNVKDPQREPAIVDNCLKSLPLERKDVEFDFHSTLLLFTCTLNRGSICWLASRSVDERMNDHIAMVDKEGILLDAGATTVSRKSSPPAQLRLWAGISRHGFWFFSDRSRYDNSATNIIMGNHAVTSDNNLPTKL